MMARRPRYNKRPNPAANKRLASAASWSHLAHRARRPSGAGDASIDAMADPRTRSAATPSSRRLGARSAIGLGLSCRGHERFLAYRGHCDDGRWALPAPHRLLRQPPRHARFGHAHRRHRRAQFPATLKGFPAPLFGRPAPLSGLPAKLSGAAHPFPLLFKPGSKRSIGAVLSAPRIPGPIARTVSTARA